jgi:hypothetical protein
MIPAAIPVAQEDFEWQNRLPRQPRRYWELLSDDKLIDAELAIDDPESLPELVREVPTSDEESYVEFKYDQRGTERDEFRCVHCHQPHLAGFVMRTKISTTTPPTTTPP